MRRVQDLQKCRQALVRLRSDLTLADSTIDVQSPLDLIQKLETQL